MNDFRPLFRFVRPYRKMLGISLIFHVLTTCFSLMMPWVLKLVVDKALGGQDLSLLWVVLGVFFVLYLTKAYCWYLCHFLTFYPALRMLFDVRLQLFKHLQRLSLRFYQEYRTGKLISNVITDVSVLQGLLTTVIIGVASTMFSMIFVIISLFILSPKLALISLFILPTTYLVYSRFRKSLEKDSMALRERMSEVSATLAETINGIKVVKSFGKERFESRAFLETLRPTFDMSFWLSMKSVSLSIIMDQLSIYCAIATLGIGGYMVLHNTMTVGELVAFYAYLNVFFGPVAYLTSMASTISDGAVSAERLMKLMDSVPEVTELASPVVLERASGHVLFDSVNFHYVEGRPVLKDFTLEVKPGTKVALVGSSGSGKSTVASLMMRFFDVKTGKILVDGVDLRDLKISSLRKNVGIVLQESFLFSGSIGDNIRYGKADATQEEVEAAARMANAHGFISELPDGYNSEVGENGVALSGGQRQRIAIARAVLHNPAILILDEATSALDTVSESVVQAALDKLMQGRTTIIIAHRLSTVRNADVIVVMKDGSIVQKGTHDKLLMQDGLYRELYSKQLKPARAKDSSPSGDGDFDGVAIA